MGLYDRDYMRERPTVPDEDGVGLSQLATRRKWLIGVGVILVLAGVVAVIMTW